MSAHIRWAVLAGETPRSCGVLGLTFQFPGDLRRRGGLCLTGAGQASTAATGGVRFGWGSEPMQARPGGSCVVLPTLAELMVSRRPYQRRQNPGPANASLAERSAEAVGNLMNRYILP